ncbi:MAG: hypothetical protein IKQ41_05950 [Clostridia bacterium]|nr:hypothetical protein [Clostridia bacterium]
MLRWQDPRAQDKLMGAAVFLLFVLSVVVRGLLLPGPHLLRTYYDELLSWGLAKTFWKEPAFSLYFLPVDFSKFVYSLVLSPLFFIKDSLLRSALAIWLNKVMISFSVFPAYRLAKKITSSRILQLLALVLFVCSPIMSYGDRYAQENLYLPLCLYLMLGYYSLYRRIDGPDRFSLAKVNVSAALLGVFACVIYFEKEAVTAFAGAFILWGLVTAVRLARKKDANWKRYLCAAAIHAAAALAAYLLVKLLLGVQFSYSNQFGLKNIDSMYKIEYLFHCIIRNWLYMCVALFGIPVLYWQIKRNRQGRLADEGTVHFNWVIFLSVSFLLTVVFLSFSVSVKEELGNENMRIHTRYFIPFLFPFFALLLEEMRKPAKQMKRAGLIGVLIVGVACVLLLAPNRYVTSYDSYDTWHVQDLTKAFDKLTEGKQDLEKEAKEEGAGLGASVKLFFADQTGGSKNVTYHHGMLLSMSAFTAFMLLITLLARKHKKAAIAVFCCLALAVEIYNDAVSLENNRSAVRSDTEMARYAALEREVSQYTDGGDLLVISKDKLEGKKRRIETVFSFDWYGVLTKDLKKALGPDGVIDLTKTQLTSCMTMFTGNRKYPKGTEINYVLCTDDVLFDAASVELLFYDPKTGFNLYSVKDQTCLDVNYILDYYDEVIE